MGIFEIRYDVRLLLVVCPCFNEDATYEVLLAPESPFLRC
jgi:hypothetical protein